MEIKSERPSLFAGFGLAGVLMVVVAAMLLRPSTHIASAQLSCEDPPIDVSRLQRIWELTDFCIFEEGVFTEIISGGVGRDGIPPIDNPEFESIESASDWLQDQSPVIVLNYEGVARAYPLGILTRHEIVNDQIGDTPIAVTFCPLCNSAIVFVRQVEGETIRLGVSGLLRNSDLIMWDDLTQTWWQQLTGTGIVGTYTGYELEFLASTLVGFGSFKESFPEGEVLSRRAGSGDSNPYVLYDSSESPFLYVGALNDRLAATARVLAVEIDEDAVAYPFEILSELRVINDVVGETEVVAFWQPGSTSALDQASIAESRDVGMAALYSRDLDGEILSFSLNEAGAIVDEQTGSQWNIFGMATAGELEGTQLRQLIAAPHFWFAWAAFKPETRIYEAE